MKNRLLPFLGMFFGWPCLGLLLILLFVNSTDVNCNGIFRLVTTCAALSKSTPLTDNLLRSASAGVACERRRTARIRATNSREENGFGK